MKKKVETECIKEMKRDIINGYDYREIEYSFDSDTILLKLDNDKVNIAFNSCVIDGDGYDGSYMLINSYSCSKNDFIGMPITNIITVINSLIYYAAPIPVF